MVYKKKAKRNVRKNNEENYYVCFGVGVFFFLDFSAQAFPKKKKWVRNLPPSSWCCWFIFSLCKTKTKSFFFFGKKRKMNDHSSKPVLAIALKFPFFFFSCVQKKKKMTREEETEREGKCVLVVQPPLCSGIYKQAYITRFNFYPFYNSLPFTASVGLKGKLWNTFYNTSLPSKLNIFNINR